MSSATGDTQFNVRDAALHGASSAFSKPPVKPKPLVNTYTGGNNGALLAATKVGTGTPRTTTPSRAAAPLGRDWTGGSTKSTARPYASPMRTLSKSSSSSALAVPGEGFAEHSPSPSNIAAKLAASRHSPMKPIPQATTTPVMSEREANERDVLPPSGSVGNVLARLDSRQQNIPKAKTRPATQTDRVAQAQRADQEDKPTDDTPIAPTTSLVNMFEQSQPVTIRSPKPQRSFKLPPEPNHGEPLERQMTKTPPPVKPKPKPLSATVHPTDGAAESLGFKALRKDTFGTPPVMQKPPQVARIKTAKPSPKSPPSRASPPKSEEMVQSTSTSYRNRRLSSSLSHHEAPSSPSSFVSAKETQEEKPKPSIPPPRRSAKLAQGTTQTHTRPKSATPQSLPPVPLAQSKPIPLLPPSERTPHPPARRASVSGASAPTGTLYHSNYQRESVKAITKHLTGDSLSDAIVGAALASSRNGSPARPSSLHLSPGPSLTASPLPGRKHHLSSFHRSPSPSKPKPQPQTAGKLRTTLRREPSSSSDAEESERYKRKGTRIMGLGRKHPNKHHEGTRKRWRDQITERERKRYEGVWAANKGLCISSPTSSRSPSRPQQAEEDPMLDVLNVVTKDIWSRSRLPDHVLEEVWDLVDSREIGRLKREEFVVGMWLIDQRLKGRKLPIKVSDSVWGSVRSGVQVKVGDRHHRQRVKK